MKTVTKLSLVAATLAAIGTSAALADDTQLRNRSDLHRQDAQRNSKSTTIAVYASHQGVGQRSAMQEGRSETRFELRTNARGQQFGLFVPLK